MFKMKNILISIGMIAAFAATDGFAANVSAHDSKPAQATAQLRSPDGNLFLKVALSEKGEPVYSLEYKGRAVILPSRLGLELKGTGIRHRDKKR